MNAVITGASKGIGLALSTHLAANKFNLALCARNAEELKKVVDHLREQFPGQQIYGLVADMEDLVSVQKFAAEVKAKLGLIDVLINNAGLFLPSDLFSEADNALKRQMQVNVHTPHYLCKFFAGDMIARNKGHIFNICSIASVKLLEGSASYSISKAALLALTRLLRESLQPHGVKVTAVLPGATLTDSWSGTSLPTERFVRADDVAAAVVAALQMSPGANVDEITIRPQAGEI